MISNMDSSDNVEKKKRKKKTSGQKRKADEKTVNQPSKKTKVDSADDKEQERTKKKKNKYRGKAKKGANTARLPNVAGGQVSSNWKRLMNEIAPAKPDFKPRRGDSNRREKKVAAKNDEDKRETKSTPDIWFDDVDEMLLDPEDREATKKKEGDKDGGDGLVKEKGFKG